MISDNNVPVIVTLLLGILAWTFTHAVDRYLQDPIIKVSKKIERTNGSEVKLIVSFENISRNTNFANLVIVILGNSPANTFTKPIPVAIGPGWLPTTTLKPAKDAIDIKFDSFHPGWTVQLTTTMTGEGDPRIQLQKSPVATVLQPAGLKTCIIENEILITTLLGGLAFLSIIVWLIFFRRNRTSQ